MLAAFHLVPKRSCRNSVSRNCRARHSFPTAFKPSDSFKSYTFPWSWLGSILSGRGTSLAKFNWWCFPWFFKYRAHKCIAGTLVSFYIQTFRFFKVTSSPSLDWDQSCQAGEQAKLNSVGGVFLGSSSILHTSVLLRHSFPSTIKPSDSSRWTPLLLQF